MSEPAIWGILWEKVFLEIWQNSQENTCARVSFSIKKDLQPKACNFIEKKTLPQVFSCEFCQVSKNTFFTEHLPAAGSTLCKNMILRSIFKKTNLLGKALKPPLFAVLSSGLKHFFNEKNLMIILITVPQFLT